MKCESCKINKIEIELSKNEGLENGIWDNHVDEKPYFLCLDCSERLKNLSLRPLEMFNLVSIHGHSFHLHDDFYEYETGEATQPEIEVVSAEKFPFPKFDQIKNDLNLLIDFSFVQYFTDNLVIKELQKFDRLKVLKRIQEKVKYNRSINYKAYEIAGKVIGKKAGDWIKEEWAAKSKNELQIFAEPISNCLETNEAFELITAELEAGDDKFLSNNISALIYLRSEQTLLWIEKINERIKNISANWGHLAASSQFSWEKADEWLTIGRPLSLVSLDALNLCTTTGERLNQSSWMRKLNPKLVNSPDSKIIVNRLHEYLKTDSVHRTRKSVNRIIENLIEVKEK